MIAKVDTQLHEIVGARDVGDRKDRAHTNVDLVEYIERDGGFYARGSHKEILVETGLAPSPVAAGDAAKGFPNRSVGE
jgi:hypothetical protein